VSLFDVLPRHALVGLLFGHLRPSCDLRFAIGVAGDVPAAYGHQLQQVTIKTQEAHDFCLFAGLGGCGDRRFGFFQKGFYALVLVR